MWPRRVLGEFLAVPYACARACVGCWVARVFEIGVLLHGTPVRQVARWSSMCARACVRACVRACLHLLRRVHVCGCVHVHCGTAEGIL